MTTTSCEDMLTPDMDRYAVDFSGKDSLYFYLGILRNVQDMAEQNILVNDIRSDLADTTAYSSDSIASIATFDRQPDGENGLLNRAAYYKVINQCNFYLAKVDTLASKNGNYYMRKEYAQVVGIRAWAYLQLVQTYGRVPFITQPVDNANTGWETNPEAWATADNLADLLMPELQKANTYERTLGYPSYGTFKTGNSSAEFSSSYVMFYTDVIMGDLYLLRSASKSDYVEAAKCYYRFLSEQALNGRVVSGSTATVSESFRGSSNSYIYNSSSWLLGFSAATYLSSSENLTMIPSAANTEFGRVLTTVAQIYGFDPSSSNSTSTEEGDDDEDDVTTTSGQVTLTANYKSRQIAPSQAYIRLNQAQNYTEPTFDSSNDDVVTEMKYLEGAGDARLYGTAPYYTSSEGTYRYVDKDAPFSGWGSNTASSPQFKYYKSFYRLSQIYLRYAEALNRAGYPRTAFAILRNGINSEYFPTLASVPDTIYDDDAKTKRPYYRLEENLTYNSMNYIGVDEIRRAQADANYSSYLDFSSSRWTNYYGIHEFGCGTSTTEDTLYSYDVAVRDRIEEESLRSPNAYSPAEVQKAVKKLSVLADEESSEDGDDSSEDGEDEIPDEVRWTYEELPMLPAEEPTDAEINAVETLILDEMALETAFEGTRMGDLIRIARHKNLENPGEGTEWFAWKISRRSLNLGPYEEPTQKDTRLYNLLLDENNWYLRNPE